MSSGDVIMGSGDDLSLEGVISGNINPTVIPDKSVLQFHAAIVIDGPSNILVPKVCFLGGSLYVAVGFSDGGHDHGLEVLGGQDYYLVVIVLSLVVVCSAR